MKRLSILFAALTLAVGGIVAKDECTIPMMVLVQNDAATVAGSTLHTRLRQAVTQNGMEGGAKFSDFSIVANAIYGDKALLQGSRPLVTITIELELFVGNNHTGEKFASTSMTLSGAGRNEAKACAAAFAAISAQNKELQDFLVTAKKKISDYYDAHSNDIISRAQAAAAHHEYEEALCLLSSVPTCSKHYNDIEKCMLKVWNESVDYDCETKLNMARNVWNASQDKEGAKQAGDILTSISPSAACFGEAKALAEEIRKRIGEDWQFEKDMQKEEQAIEKANIEAIRAIGIAYGENQKATTINEHWIAR